MAANTIDNLMDTLDLDFTEFQTGLRQMQVVVGAVLEQVGAQVGRQVNAINSRFGDLQSGVKILGKNLAANSEVF